MKGSWLMYTPTPWPWVWFIAALSLLLQACNIFCCIESERLALLEIKAYMKPYVYVDSYFSTWSEDVQKHNCCTWDYVRCNTFGRVTELNFRLMERNDVAMSVNMTLFRPFAQLLHLGLFENNINALVEIDELATLRELQVLDLNFNSISNMPFKGFCSMMNLQELHLRGNSIYGELSCLGNLTSLKVLDLLYNNITGELSSFNNLTSLEYLDLSNNNLEGTFSLSSLANLSNLKYLQLSGNRLQVHTEDSFWQPTFQLQVLGLSNCSLNKPGGIFPHFLYHQYNLSGIDLSYNDLVGAFPTWLLNNNSHLTALYLMNNRLRGNLQLPSHANLSLETLGISSNFFHGKIPDNISYVFPRMWYLNMSCNHFEGHIPTSVGNMNELVVLDLSHNNLSGEVPIELLRCSGMEVLQLSDNNLEGDIVPEQMNLPNLLWLKLSNNNFGGTINDALQSLVYLNYLDISNNEVIGQVPRWIGDLTGLTSFSVSGNFLRGQIPTEICNLSELNYLDLSQNNFTGSIPSCSNFPKLYYMHLHNNNLTGGIPNDLSTFSSLESLDLRNNQITDRIPLWINKLSDLTMLLLGGNNLHGQVPEQICELRDLNLLDLSRNKLEGEIPTCIGNMSFGKICPTLCMSGLDLSCNKFTGFIPSDLGALVHIISLNLSHNSMYGSIPHTFSNLKQIESLDLSSNNLSGMIPSELVELNFLEVFNVSYNNLSGRTIGGQFLTFDQSSYLGNLALCGIALNRSCKPESQVPPSSPIKEDGGLNMVVFFWSFSMSCVTMFFATIVILCINPQWRRSWFEFVDYHILSKFPKFNLSLY